MPILDNARHERFAQELAKGASQTDAYAAAGYNGERSSASRLATNANVQARVAELLEAAGERAEITKARVLEELGKIGFSDIRKLFTETGALKRIEDLDDAAAACLSSVEVVTRKVPGSDDNEVEHTAKLKLWDKRAALVDIGKHLGMFTDKHEITGKDGKDLIPDATDMDIARAVTFMLTKAARERQTVQ